MVYNDISNRQTRLNPYLFTDHFTLSLEHPVLSGAGAPGFDPAFRGLRPCILGELYTLHIYCTIRDEAPG